MSSVSLTVSSSSRNQSLDCWILDQIFMRLKPGLTRQGGESLLAGKIIGIMLAKFPQRPGEGN